MNQVAGVPHNLESDFTIEDGKVLVSSRDLAFRFDKRHDSVLRSIRDLIQAAPEVAHNFVAYSYIADNMKENPAYRMTRDGFTLLVMGFTGPEALRWKIKYIEAFNRMEARIRSKELGPVDITDRLPESVMNDVGGMVKKVVAKQIRDPEFLAMIAAAVAAVLAQQPPPSPGVLPPPANSETISAYEVMVNILGIDRKEIAGSTVGSISQFLAKWCRENFFRVITIKEEGRSPRLLFPRAAIMECMKGNREYLLAVHRDRRSKKLGQGRLNLVVPKENQSRA